MRRRDSEPVKTQIVLAGGAGTRMGATADTTAKHLIRIGDRPLMLSASEALAAAFGIDHCVFRVAYQADEFIRRWRDGHFPLTMPSSVLVGQLSDGPIGAVVECARIIRGRTLLFTGGDVYYDIASFDEMLAFHRAHGTGLTVGVARGLPTRRPSMLELDADGVLQGWGRPEMTTESSMINISLYLLDPELTEWLDADYREWKREHPLGEYKEDHLWRLTHRRPDRARFFPLNGRVVNVNAPKDLEAARALASTPMNRGSA